MDIIWHGNSCFTVKTKSATTVINPYTDGKGLKLPDLKSEIVIVTHMQEGNDNAKAVKGEPKLVDWPGEYEVAGVVLVAKQVAGSNGFFFNLVGDNTRVCYVERIEGKIDEELLEAIGDVDILIVSVGGKEGMDAETAHKLVEEVEPRCVIPMNFAVEGSSGDLQPADAFLKLAGASGAEPKEKLSIASRNSLKEDQTECIVLQPQV